MSDIELVIKIPEELYKEYVCVQLSRGSGKSIVYKLLNAIKKGTPLPKGHGDLKDVNDIWNNIPDVNVLTNYFTTYDIQHFIDHAPTIIEGSDS